MRLGLKSIGSCAAATMLTGAIFTPQAEAATSSCSTSDSITVCTFIDSSVTQGWITKFQDSAYNPYASTARMTCYQSSSSSVKYSITASVSASAEAWIFAKVEASVSGTAERSTTVTAGSSLAFDVPAKSTRTCKHGTYTAVVNGHTSTTIRGSSQPIKYWTATYPKQQKWLIS